MAAWLSGFTWMAFDQWAPWSFEYAYCTLNPSLHAAYTEPALSTATTGNNRLSSRLDAGSAEYTLVSVHVVPPSTDLAR